MSEKQPEEIINGFSVNGDKPKPDDLKLTNTNPPTPSYLKLTNTNPPTPEKLQYQDQKKYEKSFIDRILNFISKIYPKSKI
jgi:hypothetical protein